MRAFSLALSLIAAASSPTHTGWPPAEGVLSGSPCCPFLLKANERLFHTRRHVSRNEVGLLVFDRQFDLSNLSSTRLLVAFPAFTFPGHVHEDRDDQACLQNHDEEDQRPSEVSSSNARTQRSRVLITDLQPAMVRVSSMARTSWSTAAIRA